MAGGIFACFFEKGMDVKSVMEILNIYETKKISKTNLGLGDSFEKVHY